jgi:hypothetical protein
VRTLPELELESEAEVTGDTTLLNVVGVGIETTTVLTTVEIDSISEAEEER